MIDGNAHVLLHIKSDITLKHSLSLTYQKRNVCGLKYQFEILEAAHYSGCQLLQ